MQMIQDVTNSDKTTNPPTCNNANDYIVYNKRAECPADALQIMNDKSFTGDAKENFGNKTCMSLTGYS